MLKLLLYPNPPSDSQYIRHLYKILKEVSIVKNNQINTGLNYFECYRKFFKCDAFYFNWIESIADKKPSLFHFVMVYLLLNLLKLFKKKIIWTYHNITSHSGDSYFVRTLINWLIDNSNLIIIHSTESIPFLEKRNRLTGVSYFFHPINNFKKNYASNDDLKKEFDILIWGTMHRYKGVLEFLRHLESAGKLNKWKIKIIGGFKDKSYKKEVMNYLSSNINIEDNYASFEILANYHSKSKYVLFPYTGKSVLNSGTLTDSLNFATPVIGPYRGAFKDVADKGVILTFSDFYQIDYFLDNNIYPDLNSKNIFIEQYSWVNFKFFIEKELKKITNL